MYVKLESYSKDSGTENIKKLVVYTSHRLSCHYCYLSVQF